MTPTPDIDAALDFLRWWLPDESWTISAISPDGQITTQTFCDPNQARAWITARVLTHNLYFQVNPSIRHDLAKKASRGEIKSLVGLHVDVDPKPGEDRELERLRIRKMLESPPKGIPLPHCIISSGNGYQAFWRLDHAHAIDGDHARAEDFARYNQRLEDAFGGDHCHDISRIMRLPGTINFPNETKRKRGGIAQPTGVFLQRDGEYSLGQFTPSERLPSSTSVARKVTPGALPVLASLQDLDQWKVSADLKQLIETGTGEASSTIRDSSRSGWLFKATCGLVRAGVPDEYVLAAITNPAWGISASVLEKPHAARYAARQLERAKAVSEDFARGEHGAIRPTYANTRHAIIELNVHAWKDEFRGRCMIGNMVVGQVPFELSDEGCSKLRQLVIDTYGFDPGKVHIRDAVVQLCLENPVDPVVDELSELQWDGNFRINTWMSSYLGAEDNDYVRAVGRKLLLACVRRATTPGCKYDSIVVLEGRQGTGKSSALQILAGEDSFFTDQEILVLDARGQQEAIAGKWIVELGELAGLKRADIGKMKAFASRTHDRARPAYGHYLIDQARRCVMIGTTNEGKYLRDQSGNRRFLPVRTGVIDLDALRRDRDQLLAEAVQAEKTGEPLVMPAVLWNDAQGEQEQRRQDDVWLDLLENFSPEQTLRMENGLEERVSTQHLIREVLAISSAQAHDGVANRLVDVMKRLGWNGPEKIRINSKSVRGYVRTVASTDAEPSF